jgi:uncharacterized membrane protein
MMRFCNHTPNNIWLAFMWYQPHCMEGSDWQYAGWWFISSGGCTVVYENDLSDVHANWYFYTQGWEGQFFMPTPDHSFWRCEGETVAPGERRLGYREIDSGNHDDFTVNLT